MRQIFSFLFAAALFGGGAYIVFVNVFYSPYFYLRGFGMAVILMGIGGIWLWADFIAPLSKIYARTHRAQAGRIARGNE